MALGLSDFYMNDSDKEEVLTKILTIPWSQDSKLNSKLLDQTLFELSKTIPPSPLTELAAFLSQLENITSVSEFIAITKSFPKSEWITQSLETFSKGSPTSAGIILEQLR